MALQHNYQNVIKYPFTELGHWIFKALVPCFNCLPLLKPGLKQWRPQPQQLKNGFFETEHKCHFCDIVQINL